MRKLILLFLLLLLAAPAIAGSDTVTAVEDPHSFSTPEKVLLKHINLDLKVDFENKKLSGFAELLIENKTQTGQLILDTRDLTIEKVLAGEKVTAFHVGTSVPNHGSPLMIDIEPGTTSVTVFYSSSPEAAAVQWLTPAQTAGGKRPFVFTQSEATLARTWVPCQDTPSVRITYHARIHTPKGVNAVMSAERISGSSDTGEFDFRMDQPIPSYLLALAVGDLAFRPISKRCGIYAEPSVVEKAAWEFAETEKMIAAAEKLYGPYRWGRYDILVLPPSFPFGGMENPRMTFATPTVIAGDRSLVSLIAHELAHSWSGNLVTNATWDDYWLNEGFTVYLENRIMEELYGKEYADMLVANMYVELQEEVKDAGTNTRSTWLKQQSKGEDADGAVNMIGYDKGYFFLRMIEEAVGRTKWDAFLHKYFDHFAFQSLTTEQFLVYLRQNLIQNDKDLEKKLMIDAWVYGPGIPANLTKVESARFHRVEAQAAQWKKGKPSVELETKDWTTHEWLRFFQSLPEELTADQMAGLDAAFHFTASGNSEILFMWLSLSIQHNYKPAYPAVRKFLLSIGRNRFVVPLYRALSQTPEGKAMAKEIYAQARAGYHPLTAASIDRFLGESEKP